MAHEPEANRECFLVALVCNLAAWVMIVWLFKSLK